jgi:gliding-associated putative ABC transporter substrate-binding component GldG
MSQTPKNPTPGASAEKAMRSRKLRTSSNALVTTLAVIGILIVANVIAFRTVARVDLTHNKNFTLSAASKKIVGELKDRLTVKAYISRGLPSQADAVQRYMRDLLEDYAAHSRGNMVWEVIDPTGDAKAESAAKAAGVNKVSMQVIAKDKFEAKEVYLGISLSYGGKTEKIPLVRNPDTLEYEITSLLKKMVTEKKKKIGFTTGSGEPTFSAGLAHAKAGLDHYEVVTVNLKEGKPIPDDLDALIVVPGSEAYTPRAIYELDQYLMKGKAVALLIDNVVIDPKTKLGRLSKHGLDKWLKHAGVEIGSDLVLDLKNQRVQVQVQPGYAVVTNYPPFPVITQLAKEHPIMRDLQGMVLPFVSSLSVDAAKKNTKLQVTELARSSGRSWLQKGTDFFFVDPLKLPRPTDDSPRGPFTVAAALRGTFPSYYAGKAIPAKNAPAGEEPKAAEPISTGDDADRKTVDESSQSARLVVIGDGDFAKDSYIVNQLNKTFFYNLIDWLASDEDLIAIRAKQVRERPLKEVSGSVKNLIKYGNTFGVGFLCVAFGLLRWRLRRQKARQLKLSDLA